MSPSRVLDAHDDHVLREPALLIAQVGGDPEGDAFLSQERVPAVAGADAHDEVVLGEMHDEAPLRVEVAYRMEALHEAALGVDDVEHRRRRPSS